MRSLKTVQAERFDCDENYAFICKFQVDLYLGLLR